MKRVRGKVDRADDRALVIGTRDARPPLTLRITPGTLVTLDGRPSRAESLPAGADVRAAYRTGDGGRPTALSVEARRAPELPPPERGDDEQPPSTWGTPEPREDGGD